MDLFEPICFNLPILSRYCIGARIDITTLTHFVGGIILVLLFYGITKLFIEERRTNVFLSMGLAIGYLLGEEMAQGSCSVQGFDLIDLFTGLLGVALAIFFVFKPAEND